MKSYSSVKSNRMYAFGSRDQIKVNPWYSMPVNKKRQKLFGIFQKIYVSDWNRVFKKKALYKVNAVSLQNSVLNGKNQFKYGEMTSLLTSNFWAYRHPMPVPGVLKIKKSKAYYKNSQKNLSNILLWFGGMTRSTFLSLCQETTRWNKLYQNLSFALIFDSLYPNLILKTGLTKNVYSAKKSLSQRQSMVNFKQDLYTWSVGNSTTTISVKNQFFLKNLRNFQKNMYKQFNNSCL